MFFEEISILEWLGELWSKIILLSLQGKPQDLEIDKPVEDVPDITTTPKSPKRIPINARTQKKI